MVILFVHYLAEAVTGYSTNAGIIAVTGVASRRAIMAGGGVLLLFGFMPKLMYVIASIPHPVISGVFAIICVIIAMNGFRVIQHIQLNERNMLVIGIPILVSLGTAVMPREILYSMPQLASYLLSSGIAIGAILAVLMNALIPNEKTAGEVTE
nr:solute carrier family 23 protein [Shewanella marina]